MSGTTETQILAEWRSDAGHGDQAGIKLETTPGDVLVFIQTTDTDSRVEQIGITPWEAEAILPALQQWVTTNPHYQPKS